MSTSCPPSAGPHPRSAHARRCSWLCLAATWLVWGSTYLAIKFALLSFPPFFQMGTRFLVAGVLLMAWMRWRGAPWPKRASGATRSSWAR